MKSLFALVLSVMLFPSLAISLTFKITNLTESSDVRVAPHSLNASGLICALTASDEGWLDIIFLDKGGNIINLTNSQFDVLGRASLNDKGQVAFLAFTSRADIILFDGSTFMNLTNQMFQGLDLSGQSLNNNGQVAFAGDTGEIFFDGNQFTNITKNSGISFSSLESPVINDNGRIAFLGITSSPFRADMFLFTGASIINLSADPSLQITDVNGSPSINNKNKVLFLANTTTSPNDLFLFDGSTTINLTTTFGLPTSEPFGTGAPALNNNDQLAFSIVVGNNGPNGPRELWFFDMNGGSPQKIGSLESNSGMGALFINDSAEMVFAATDSTGQTDVFFVNPIPPLEVIIDIKPGKSPNSINPRSNAPIPVAILTMDAFNAITVDPSTIHFGATGTEATPLRFSLEDVNRDGRSDLLLQFRTRDTNITCGATSASLTGQTFSEQEIEGSDAITTMGCR